MVFGSLDLSKRAWERRLTMKLALLALVAALLFSSPAMAQVVDAGSGDGSGSALAPDAGSAVLPATGSAAQPTLDTLDGARAAYGQLQASYTAYKNAEPSTKPLLLAGLLAVALKYLLDIVNLVAKRRLTKYLAWVALALAVPIALLSKFAAGTSWFDAILFAGSGPGAIVVHELIAHFTEKKSVVPPPKAEAAVDPA